MGHFVSLVTIVYGIPYDKPKFHLTSFGVKSAQENTTSFMKAHGLEMKGKLHFAGTI